ncbi:SRPBCC domain-containing protein [Arthrobacter sp. Sr24]
MHNLFSHVHEPDYVAPQATQQLEDGVLIDVPVDQAFDGFTDGIHLWWPVSEQSVFGDGSHIALLRNHLVEESIDGEEIIWADIVEWEAPEHLNLLWVFGNDPESEREVDVVFEAANQGMTRVKITFHQSSAGEDLNESEFSCDWPLILSRYARFMGGAVQLD